MKAFVLAAGFGSRLSPITDHIPKPLLPVGNLPLIGYALRFLAYHGITDVIVNLHHLAKILRDTLGDGSAYGVRLTYSFEEEILGTGGGLKRMHEALSDGTFVVVNSDTIVDFDLHAVIAAHKERGALATMVLREAPPESDYGPVEIDGDAWVRRILGQGRTEGTLQRYMFTGVHVMEPRLLEYIPLNINTCVNRYAYMKAISNDELIHGAVVQGYWADAGTAKSYFAANEDALAQRMHLRHIDPLAGFALAPKRAVADVVRMGEEVDLGVGVRIAPPVLLGDETRVGDHATLGPCAVVGPRVQIGRDAVVERVVILEGAKIDAGARVQNMIVSKRDSLPFA